MPDLLRRKAITAALALSAAGVLTPAFAHQQDAPEERVLVGFSYAGVEAFFVDPNDAALKRAFNMILPRIMEMKSLEIAQQSEFGEIPDEMIESGFTLLTAPLSVVVTQKGTNPDTGTPVFHGVISFETGEAGAKQAHAVVGQLQQMAGGQMPVEPSERWDGMSQLVTPVGPVHYGPRQAGDGWRYEIVLGQQAEPDAIRAMLPTAPAGQQQLASGFIDFEALTPYTGIGLGFLSAASPQGQQISQQLVGQGIFGEGAIAVEAASWTDGVTNTTRVITRRAKNFREGFSLPESTLTPADFAIVPADATAASIFKMSPDLVYAGFLQQITSSAPGMDENIARALEEIERETGINVERDIIAALGETGAMYFSDSTGGGSLLSGVIAIQARDTAKLQETIGKIEGLALGLLDEEIDDELRGLFGLRTIRSTVKGNPIVSYVPAGLPVPVVPSMAVIGDWFVMGMSPQAVMAAANHTGRANGRGLLDNPRFAAAYNAQPDTVAVSFVDTQRTMMDGLTTLNLGAMTISNLMTSPDGERPAVPTLVPSPQKLLDGAQPFVQHSYWNGEDLVQVSTTDASALVSIAGILGVGDTAPLVSGILLGAGIGGAIAEQSASMNAWEDDWDNDDWEEDPDF